jgi:pimeloyl-ACP methyl ester carboxylesterase
MTGYKNWANGSVRIEDLGEQALRDSKEITITVNGLMNEFDEAVQKGFQQIGDNPYTIAYNESSGFIADLTESFLDKFVGPSNKSVELADLFYALDLQGIKINLVAHSQGTLIATNALEILRDRGIVLSNLQSIAFNGPAVTPWAAEAMAQFHSVSPENFSYFSNSFDFVGNVIGTSTLNPLKLVMSTVLAPTMFMGPKLSQHSNYPPAFPGLYAP